MAITFTASVHKLLSGLSEKFDLLNPDQKHNTGRIIGRAAFWDQVEKYAKGQSERAWKELEDEEIIKRVDSAGTHTLAESPSFSVIDKVSEPRKSFKEDVLAAALKKKYKVPEPITRELVGKAKVPGNRVHTMSIVERS